MAIELSEAGRYSCCAFASVAHIRVVCDFADGAKTHYVGFSIQEQRVVELGNLSVFHRVASFVTFLFVLVIEAYLPTDVSVSGRECEFV